jgi:uncharacterized damage-inducible protein DinB
MPRLYCRHMKTLMTCTTSMILASSLLAAQTPAPADTGYAAALRSRWNAVKRNVAASAAAMPEANYAYKPTPDVRSFGELIGHLANEHYLLCSPAKGEKNPKEAVDFEKTAAKADLVKAINESIAYCDTAYAVKDSAALTTPRTAGRGDTPFSSMLLNVTHDSEHYGNIVTYLRLKGIVPPSSAPTR